MTPYYQHAGIAQSHRNRDRRTLLRNRGQAFEPGGFVTVKNKIQPKRKSTPIPASTLLLAEASRLEVLRHAMPDSGEAAISAQVWAYRLAAAFLDSLGAPEKLVRYIPAP